MQLCQCIREIAAVDASSALRGPGTKQTLWIIANGQVDNRRHDGVGKSTATGKVGSQRQWVQPRTTVDNIMDKDVWHPSDRFQVDSDQLRGVAVLWQILRVVGSSRYLTDIRGNDVARMIPMCVVEVKHNRNR